MPEAANLGGVKPGIHVAVVDRHLTFADTIAADLRSQSDVANATALTSADTLWRVLERHVVDVVLLDQDLPTCPGVSAVQRIRELHPATRVVVVSSKADPAEIVDALTAGAAGWVPKTLPLDQLLDGLRAVIRGETWVPGRVLTLVLQELTNTSAAGAGRSRLLQPLTAREMEILQCMVDGMSRTQIAEHLYMSPNTVRTHVQNVLHKLGVHSSLRAVSIARQAGLVSRGTQVAEQANHPVSNESKG